MKLLSERIKYILEDAKIEPTDLVVGSGASHSVVSQWMSGDIKSMNLKFALEIERRYGYSHIWLMINEGEKKVTSNKKQAGERIAANSDAVTAADLVRLVNAFSAANAEQRSIILAAVTAAERVGRKNVGTGN